MVKVLWNHEDLMDHNVPLNKSVLFDAKYKGLLFDWVYFVWINHSILLGCEFSFPKQHQIFTVTWHKIKGEAEGTQLSFLLHQSFAALHQNTEKQTQVQLVYIGFHLHLLVI